LRHELSDMSQKELAGALRVKRRVIMDQERRGRRQIERRYDYAVKWFVRHVLGLRVRLP